MLINTKFLDEVKELSAFHYKNLQPLRNKYVDYRILEPEKYNPDAFSEIDISDYIKEIEKDEILGYLVFVDNKLTAINIDESYKNNGLIVEEILKALNSMDFNFSAYFSKIASPQESKFNANHYLNLKTGAFIYVPKNLVIEKPLHILFIHSSDNVALYPHILLILDKNSKFNYIDYVISKNEEISGFYNPIYEVYLHDDSILNFLSIYRPNLNVYSYGSRRVIINRDSKAYVNHVWLGGKYSVNYMELFFNGEGSEGEDNQIFLGRSKQFYSLYSKLMHRVGSSVGNVLVKGALKDKARSHFDGLIKIFPKAQKSNAYLQEHTLLLNPETRSDAIPGLEISSNDVRCTHSATVSEVDSEKLFYLKSRGISEEEAKKLLVLGHFQTVLEKINIENLKEKVIKMIDAVFK
ncbi:MAG: Fe-S cluster assembly protein SufD [candidate division WOR-3 bacterium]|nr:Fe-S cluster assembly protein SufD [candidate division WOR-3 bacterium]MCX7948219.1 Fe-S cluster assembly protein SufD [candidate division WOR-3 bacterium]MDW8150021.1 Fe-S cluster assembly protein SufD [candidate division WOR-3 bacterium]